MEILNIEEIVNVKIRDLEMLILVNKDLFRYLIVMRIVKLYLRVISFFFVYEGNRLRILVFGDLLEKLVYYCIFNVFLELRKVVNIEVEKKE